MPRKFTRNASENKKIARERVNELFKQAEKAKEKALADRYVELARKIAMRYKIRIPTELKRRVCKNCYSYLRPGKNVRIRINEGKVIYYCLECKKYMRFVAISR